MLKPIAEIDDLITIEGYGERVFRIDSVTLELTQSRVEEYEEVLYDCHCVVTAEYMLAVQDDIEIVRKAADADGFLRTYQMPKIISPFQMIFGKPITEVYDMQKRAEELAKETERKAEKARLDRIDELLDLRNEASKLSGFDSDAEEEAFKQRRYDEIDAELKELRARGIRKATSQ